MGKEQGSANEQRDSIRPDQLLRALAHPRRVEILRRLAGKAESRSRLAREIQTSNSAVSYHVEVLEKCEVVEAVEEDDNSGGRLLRLRSPFRVAGLGLDKLRPVLRQGVIAALLSEFVSLASAAIEEGSIRRRDGANLSFRPSLLDPDGWTQANLVLRSADEEIEMIEGESRQRMKTTGGKDAIHAVFGLALFEAAESPKKPTGES
jgi:DNA-binding transcriptional ArsR family regulator